MNTNKKKNLINKNNAVQQAILADRNPNLLRVPFCDRFYRTSASS